VKLVADRHEQLAAANEALERNLARSMDLCVHALRTFYPALGDQARRAAALCGAMATALNLSPDDRRILESAALLHDLGLVGLSRSLIRRWQEAPESLAPAESALVRRHPILGQELAAIGSGLDRVGELIRVHHERFDGKGYPDGLAGEKIPWLGRLLAVAVAFASSRLIRSDAVEEIKMQSGAAFDPEAVRAFLKALPLSVLSREEREIPLTDLRPGMVLARGIYTANGLLLVPEGQQLTHTYIEKLLNQNRVQPIIQSLVVYC